MSICSAIYRVLCGNTISFPFFIFIPHLLSFLHTSSSLLFLFDFLSGDFNAPSAPGDSSPSSSSEKHYCRVLFLCPYSLHWILSVFPLRSFVPCHPVSLFICEQQYHPVCTMNTDHFCAIGVCGYLFFS